MDREIADASTAGSRQQENFSNLRSCTWKRTDAPKYAVKARHNGLRAVSQRAPDLPMVAKSLHSQNTTIPIPEVYGHDLNENAIGCPFIFMKYIHGNTAEEVSRTYPGEHEGIPSQFEDKFWRQYAKIMIQLASIRLLKIGSIVQNSDGLGSFVVGPLVDTGSGPYDSAAKFYADYPLTRGKSLQEGELRVSGQEELVYSFRSLAASFLPPTTQTRQSLAEGFGLSNYDLGPNNIIVDRDFNALAVIDWDSVIAVPDAALYRFPYFMGVDCAIAGVVGMHPAVTK
ncbi:MAG: hypothetical protein Q9228_002320 [Teloschistes exilis]